MESSQIQNRIGQKYKIKEKIGVGTYSNVFLVEDNENQREYAAKIMKHDSLLLDEEIEILNKLKEYNNPYIINIIESGEDEIVRADRKTKRKKYCILEHAPYGNIHNYIDAKKEGFGRLYSKIIFKKIVQGVKCFHDEGICNLDIKLQNILFDRNFDPKICDFGFACINSSQIKKNCGTEAFKAPEVGIGRYNGLKADIFSLGTSLILLVTGKLAFENAILPKSPYQDIIKEKYKKFWRDFKKNHGMNLSPEFEDLCNNMICFNPELRLDCGKILEHVWFKEINDMEKNDKEKYNELEQKLRNHLLEYVDIVKNNSMKIIKAKNELSLILEKEKQKKKSFKLYEPYFLPNLKPKYEKIPYSPMNMNNCIKIHGYLDPTKFMNNLYYYITDKYNNECFIDKNENKLKFNLIFEETNDKEDNEKIKEELKKIGFEVEEDDEEEIYKLVIQVKLYQISDGYLLRFAQLEGNRNDFLDKYNTIADLVKGLI